MPRKAPSKRGLTLDLSAPVATKKTRLQQAAAAAAAPVLTTPDVQMLKLSSPELAKFLTSSNSLPSGSTLPTPTAGSGTYLFPKNVTEEQELYAKGFEEALNSLKSKEAGAGDGEEGGVGARRGAKSAGKAAPAPPKGSSAVAIEAIERATSAHNTRAVAAAAVAAATAVAGTTGGQIPVAVSDIPSAVAPTSSVPARVASSPRPPSAASGSVDSSECDSLEIKEERTDDEGAAEEPSSSSSTSSNNKRKRSSGSAASSSGGLGVSPIDMEDQEKIKLERKRMRNRLAATKCRKRKLERISHLDDRVAVLKGENAELAAVVKRLKASVCELKQEVMEHINSGCQIMIADESGAFS